MTASPEQVEQYEHDGVLFPMPVLSLDEVLQFRSAYERLEAHWGKCARQLISPACYRWATISHKEILNILKYDRTKHIGPSMIFPKYPRESDGSVASGCVLLGLSEPVDFPVALTDSNIENGCMRGRWNAQTYSACDERRRRTLG